MTKPSLCERVAAPLLKLHHRTSSPAGTGILAAAAALLSLYGVFSGNLHLAWLGGLGVVVAWYGFVLHGCDRLLTRASTASRNQGDSQI